jgi:hypothetical protein
MIPRRRASTAAAAALFAAASAAASAPAAQADLVAARRSFTSGTIVVNRGALGIAVGMKRAQVIDALGRPAYENKNGYMGYIPLSSKSGGIFDVYRDGGAKTSRVRMISIAGRGSGWKLQDGNAIFTRGGLKRLATTYGRRLHFGRADDGEPFYEIHGRHDGKPVTTSFAVASKSLNSLVGQIFITEG